MESTQYFTYFNDYQNKGVDYVTWYVLNYLVVIELATRGVGSVTMSSGTLRSRRG